jgi:hypothetical protein
MLLKRGKKFQQQAIDRRRVFLSRPVPCLCDQLYIEPGHYRAQLAD